jgi:hypothetical protein
MKNTKKLMQKLKELNQYLNDWGEEKIELSEALFSGLLDYLNDKEVRQIASDIYNKKSTKEQFMHEKLELENHFD